jgi:hypothetical protein
MLRALVIHVGYSVRASYYDDWLDAFLAHPDLSADAVNVFHTADRRELARRARAADLVVILHSGAADTLDYVRAIEAALLERRGPLVVFMGNEFNTPWLTFDEKRNWLRSVHADVVATQLVEETGAWLYDGSGARVISVPHALNPSVFRWRTPRASRPIDIGSRSFPYPVYLGDSLRNEMFRRILDYGDAKSLCVDLNMERRLDRAGWSEFLDRCRFTAATEAGSSFLERDDALAFAIRDFLRERRKGLAISPNNRFRRVARKIPWSVRERVYRLLKRFNVSHEAIEDDPRLSAEVIQRFFAGREPAPHSGRCISSRHFDAIGSGTVQLLVEGRYNDLLTPGLHYVPLKADFSDLAETLDQIRDPAFAGEIAECALAHVLERHTHRHRIDALIRAIF